MMPAVSESLNVSSMAPVSGADRENRRPLGGVVPGCRSLVQSCAFGPAEYLLQVVLPVPETNQEQT